LKKFADSFFTHITSLYLANLLQSQCFSKMSSHSREPILEKTGLTCIYLSVTISYSTDFLCSVLSCSASASIQKTPKKGQRDAKTLMRVEPARMRFESSRMRGEPTRSRYGYNATQSDN
jgi:hypothetical protein